MKLPEDPVMLLSFVNMKLRDQYTSLDDLCDDLNVLSVELEEKLGEIGYFYNAKENRFVGKPTCRHSADAPCAPLV